MSISVNPNDITNMIKQVNDLKTEVENKINSAKADFGDDGLFNATAEGSSIGTTDLTMEKVNSMSFEQIQELMASPSDAEINANLKAEERNLEQYMQEFERVQVEIANLQDEITAIEAEITKLTNEQNDAINLKVRYEAAMKEANDEVAESEREYKTAISNKNIAEQSAEDKAYEDAIEEFAKQSAAVPANTGNTENEEGEENNNANNNTSNNVSFSAILAEKRASHGLSSSYDSAIAEAANKVADKKAIAKRYESMISVQESVIQEKGDAIKVQNNNKATKNSELQQKTNSLTTISNNVQICQSNIAELEQQMAVRNFINQNKEAILDVAYEKDPAAIASRQEISNAETTVNDQLTIAQNAEAAATQAAKEGNAAKAEEEKQKAEAARQAAEAAKQKAEAEKAKLEATYGTKRTADQASKVQGMGANVQAIQAAAANAAKAIENASAVATAQSTIAASTATVATQVGIAQQAQAAAQDAINKGDTAKAEEEKQKVLAAIAEAKKAQEAAKAAEAKLKELGATDQKAAEIASMASGISGMESLATNIDNAIKQVQANAEAAPAREAAGVTYATNAEGAKDVNRLDLTSMISAAELALVTANGVNLAEPIEVTVNGQKCYYPRYVIAKAADGKYHIYERSVDKNGAPKAQLQSLARKYGNKGGYDIIKSGSGYMNNTKEVDAGAKGAKEVYYITCASADFKSCQFGTTHKSYSTGSPLSLDLNGDGVKTSQNVIDYDIDGDGIVDSINDSADAVLVFDKDGDGVSGANGSECFGDNTDLDGDGKADGYKDGFEALKALALREGLINNNDDMQLDEKDIKYLEENFGFKIKAGGYNDNAQSLSNFGITCINLAKTNETTLNKDFDGMGNDLMTQEGATFVQNGQTKDYADLWHAYIKEEVPEFLGLTLAA